MRVWLASASPRRRDLLRWAGIDVVGRPAPVDEAPLDGEDPAAMAERLARLKCAGPADEIVLAADTVVHLDGRSLGKPADPEEAHAMLRALAGRWHRVTTGVAIRTGSELHSFRVSTAVRFRALTDSAIARYVATGEPMDKAGAYGIQGVGGALVAEVNGCWTNVMGLPLERTLHALEQVCPSREG